MGEKAVDIAIKGLVQGVGFRPFIYRLASSRNLSGWVDNRTDCVSIHVEGDAGMVDGFVRDIPLLKPLPAEIHELSVTGSTLQNDPVFIIRKSRDGADPADVTEVSPDIAVCDDCLRDLDAQEHRLSYPYINCTNCGPRFSIIRDLPYDRDKTTMDPFPMCDICRTEYGDILDRRFHAQPVACNQCGPSYTLHMADGRRLTAIGAITSELASLLKKGGIAAMKGMGGYNLVCNALDEETVRRLRQVKNRESKPFAVMFGSVESANEFLETDEDIIEGMISWRRPILLVPTRKALAPSVNNGFSGTGAMLPSLPIHHLLWKKLDLPALVFTSGNLADDPIVIDDSLALETFMPLVDAVLTGERDIHNRCDDSVAMPFHGDTILIRRSRGYAPSPVRLGFDAEGIFAAGAELVNCFAIGRGQQAILSQHQGDLKNFETFDFYKESFSRFSRLYRFKPELAAVDIHPDYLSTRFGHELGIPLVEVQHHHAHIASVMAEHGIDHPVVGISMDGTGLGTDGNIWGAEFMVCDYAGFERAAHFAYIPLPGGDMSVKEPWRIALSCLIDTYGDEGFGIFRELFPEIVETRADLVRQSIQKRINAPLSDSAGRLFDAVAALTGVCRLSGFHAEAPMRLESVSAGGVHGEYSVDEDDVISFRPAIRQIVDDLRQGRDASYISARFHQTIAGVCSRKASDIAAVTGISTIALSGGVFQNRILLSLLLERLEAARLKVLYHKRIPSNDGGLALGQLAVAAHVKTSKST